MMHDENQTMLNLLADYFPRLADRITKSPALLLHITKTFSRIDTWTCEQAMLRYATTHNADPTWDQLLETVEQVQADAKRADAWSDRGKDFDAHDAMQVAYEQAIPQIRADADKAWAKMHVQFVLQGIASEKHAAKQIPRYEDLMRQYPALEQDCLRQIRRLQHAPLGTQNGVPSLYKLSSPVESDGDDVPF